MPVSTISRKPLSAMPRLLHRARQKNPEAVVVAVGCYVQTGQEAIRKDVSSALRLLTLPLA